MSGTGLDRSRKLLSDLGFEFAPKILPELLEQSVRDEHTLQQFLEQVLVREREAREERRIKTALKLSGLSLAKTLEDYDFAFQRGVDRNHIDLLATCEFARRKENILFLGPPGVGKSHLAQALGIKAIQNGFSVTFVNAVGRRRSVGLTRHPDLRVGCWVSGHDPRWRLMAWGSWGGGSS